MNSLNKAIYQKAKELYDLKEYHKAEVILKRLFEDNSHDVYVNHLMAMVLVRLHRDIDTIVGHLKNILYLGVPKRLEVQTYLLMGYLYLNKGCFDLAEKYLNELQQKPCKNVQLYSLLGYLNYQKKDFHVAEKYYQQALELSPKNANSLNSLGCTYLEMKKNITQAHQYIFKALEQDKNNYAYLDSMGWYYMLVRRFKEALSYLTHSLHMKWHAITDRRLQYVKRLFR